MLYLNNNTFHGRGRGVGLQAPALNVSAKAPHTRNAAVSNELRSKSPAALILCDSYPNMEAAKEIET